MLAKAILHALSVDSGDFVAVGIPVEFVHPGFSANEHYLWVPRPNVVQALENLGSAGEAYAAWTDFRYATTSPDTPNIYTTRSLDYGLHWSANLRANDDPIPADHGTPAISAGAAGLVYVAWRDKRNGDYDIYRASSNDRGQTWGANMRLNDDVNWAYQTNPAVVTSFGGLSFVAWTDQRNGKLDVYGARATLYGGYLPMILAP